MSKERLVFILELNKMNMKRVFVFSLLIFISVLIYAQSLKPYVAGLKSDKSISALRTMVQEKFADNNIKIIGEYQPANDKNRWLIIFNCDEIEKSVELKGGLTGFALALRLAITQENGFSYISYTNPEYWGAAYFRNDFKSAQKNYQLIAKKLEEIMLAFGSDKLSYFGSEDGLDMKELKKYRYMFGMPEFDDTRVIAKFSSYDEAVKAIDKKFKGESLRNIEKVYEVERKDQKLKLYGVALSGKKGESYFMSIIDINTPKHTAFLPYEFLVVNNEVHMLHGRFRIALSFPDLSMGTFTKIMSTPGDIENQIKQIVE